MRRRNPEEFDAQYAVFRQRMARVAEAPTYGDAILLFRSMHALAPLVLREKQVPTHRARSFTSAVKELDRRRVPKDLPGWFRKHGRVLELLVESASWPDKGTIETLSIRVDNLTVHNQTDKDVTANVKLLETATNLMRESGVPRIDEAIYGDVYLVGSISRNHNLSAQYIPARDVMIVLLVKRFEAKFVESVIHEFGHRYWQRFLGQEARTEWARHHLRVHDDAANAYVFRIPKVGESLPYTHGGPKVVTDVRTHPSRGQILVLEDGSAITLDNYWKVSRKNEIMSAYPTLYAAGDKEEHFCEALAHYCLGELAPHHAEAFERIVGVQKQEQARSSTASASKDDGPKGQMSMFNPARARAIGRRLGRI